MGTGGHAGGIKRDTKETQETPRGPAGGHSGGVERHTKRTGGSNGGIGAGHKATKTQRSYRLLLPAALTTAKLYQWVRIGFDPS